MFLSIDYGQKYVGLAMADEKLKIALPYKTLENKGGKFLFDEIKEIIKKEKINKIIVGRPLGMNSKATEQTKIIDQFIQKLKKVVDLPVESFDERLTSKMAKTTTNYKSKYKYTNNKNVHAVAAMIILQGYLDSLK